MRTQPPRYLILHIGGSKTGSSALQEMFARNADVLRAAGVDYLHAPELKRNISGNGVPLFKVLHFAGVSEIAPLVESYFDRNTTALCSCELLSADIAPDAWQRLAEVCQSISVRPLVIMFVRDVYPFALSSYHQRVKRHGETRTFAEFVRQPFEWHSSVLRSLARAFEPDEIRVLHYESEVARLGDAFFKAATIDHSKFDTRSMSRRINRSLTSRELSIMLIGNGKIGQFGYSPPLSEDLTADDNDIAGEGYPADGQIVDQLAARYQHDVSWINDRYFDGGPVVKIVAPDWKGAANTVARLPASVERALGWAFDEIAALKEQATREEPARI